jgi:hypothetical protein
MNAELSSHLLVLCAASTDPRAVGWQNAGRARGGGEQQAVPGRPACGQRLGMCDVRTLLKDPRDILRQGKKAILLETSGIDILTSVWDRDRDWCKTLGSVWDRDRRKKIWEFC